MPYVCVGLLILYQEGCNTNTCLVIIAKVITYSNNTEAQIFVVDVVQSNLSGSKTIWLVGGITTPPNKSNTMNSLLKMKQLDACHNIPLLHNRRLYMKLFLQTTMNARNIVNLNTLLHQIWTGSIYYHQMPGMTR